MDQLRQHKAFSDSLKATLNCYRLSSANSLGGPSGYSALAAQLWVKENKKSPPLPPTPPILQIPLLMPKDTSSQRSETLLAGEKISCFIVGGEKRLCLPQILTTVLKDFSISEINRTCADLQIYCSRCSPDQLEILKVLGVLPFNTTQCGLITKSDAERLISLLSAEHQPKFKHDFIVGSGKSIRIFHECFGQGDGLYYPDLYVTADAPCISCYDCRMKLSPYAFVTHSHRGLEKRTCHWGFDREKWRHYIFIPKYPDASCKEEEEILNEMKRKFDDVSFANSDKGNRTSPTLKRKIQTEVNLNHGKRFKEESSDFSPNAGPFPQSSYVQRPSAFKPWPSNLPSAVPSPPKLPTSQQSVFLKALEPFFQAGKLLPPYFPFMPTGVVPRLVPSMPTTLPPIQPPVVPPTATSNILTDWLGSSKSSQKVPNVTLDPSDQQKRAEDFILMKNRLREETMKRKNFPLQRPIGNQFWNQLHQARGLSLKKEVAETATSKLNPSLSFSESFTKQTPLDRPQDRHSPNYNKRYSHEVPPHSHSALYAPRDTKRAPPDDNENDEVDVIGDVDCAKEILKNAIKKKSQDSFASETKLIKNGDSSLQTASADVDTLRNSPLCLSRNSNDESNFSGKHRNTIVPSSTYPIVVSLKDAEKHHKWDFSSGSYVISWSGTQELTRLRNLMTSSSEEKSGDILHEVVKIVWRSEESSLRKTKTIKDLQSELSRMKTSQEKLVKETCLNEEKLRQELNRAREEYRHQINEVNDSFVDLSKKLTEINEHSALKKNREIFHQGIIDQLHKRADERERDVIVLEEQLIEVKKKKNELESQLNKLANASQANILAFMSGIPASQEDSYTSYKNKNFTSTASTDKLRHCDDYQSDDETNNSQSSPLHQGQVPRKSPSKDSGVHDV